MGKIKICKYIDCVVDMYYKYIYLLSVDSSITMYIGAG